MTDRPEYPVRGGDAGAPALLDDLGRALDSCLGPPRGSAGDDCQFRLFYQPVIDLRSGQLTGAEALLRWDHPALGIVSPGRFIGPAEDSGMMVPIGEWVVRSVCTRVQAWRTAGLPPAVVSVNMSRNQLGDARFLDAVASALRDSGLAPAGLGLEMDAGDVLVAPDSSLVMLRELAATGVSLSVDARGQSDMDMQALARLPFSHMKIGRELVGNLDDGDARADVIDVLTFAREQGLGTVAVGVETERHRRFLRRHGCDGMQGYLSGRPVPPERFAELPAALPK